MITLDSTMDGRSGSPRANVPAMVWSCAGGRRSMPAARGDETDISGLVVRIAERADKEAFKTLFVAFAPRVKTYLIRHGAAADRAEELAQETLLTVWRKAAYYDPARASAAAWMFTIARNLRIDTLRREKSAVAYALSVHEPEVTEETPQTANEIAQAQVRVRQAIATLSSEQLQVVQLSFYEDKAHAEIAQQLSLPLGTVKSRLRLALARLRGLVGDLA
jgi:RNA polymerase sigma-70 factor (ECF subfamily)